MNAVLYARVSTDKQAKNELSIPAQIHQMVEYCRRKEWGILQQFREEGKSATSTDRPELKRLLDFCRKTKNVNVVLVHKIDRFARNVYDYAAIKAILKKQGIRLVSVVENFEDTVTGQLVENIMASIAQFYSQNLGEEVKKGTEMMLKRGGWPSHAPLGYKNSRDEEGKAYIEVDKETAPKVQRIFDFFSTGDYSLDELSEEAFEMDICTMNRKKLSPEGIKNILSNPFYIGKMRWNGTIYEGKHEAIIEVEKFMQAQEVLKKRGVDTGEKGKLNFLMRGISYCAACGEKLTAERHPRGTYYRCIKNHSKKKCNQSYIPVKKLDAQLPELYVQLIPPQKVLRLVKREMEELAEKREKMAREEIEPLKRRVNKEKDKQLELADRLASKTITPEIYNKLNVRYQVTITKMEERLLKLDQDFRRPLDLFDKCIVISSGLLSLHRKFDFEGKKKLLKAVFERVYVRDKQIVGVKSYPPFDFLLKDGLQRTFKDHPSPPTLLDIFEQLLDLPFSPRLGEIVEIYTTPYGKAHN